MLIGRPTFFNRIVTRSALQRNWLSLVIVVCATLLVLLAGLQYVWTGQLSRAQQARMQNALSNSMRQFEQEIQRELLYLLVVFQPEGRISQSESWGRDAERYNLWAQTTSHPQLLRRLLIYSSPRLGNDALRELEFGEARPVRATWAGELAVLKKALAESEEHSGPDARLISWTLYPEARAIVRPFTELDRTRRSRNRSPRLVLAGYLILVLDWDYVAQVMMPDLVQRFFAGPDGERVYEVAVLADGGEHFLYRSDEGLGAGWLEGADSRRRLRLLRAMPTRLPAAAAPLEGTGPLTVASGREGPPGTEDGKVGEAGTGPRAARRLFGPGRTRMILAGDESPLDLEIVAKHVSGSLDRAVAQQRLRNLGQGFGVLLLLAGATALVVVSARRAAQLAAMQMEFVAGITHELRTPLSVICSVGENLADGVVGAGQQARRYGQLIRDQGSRLTELVEQTLQFAALEAGQRRFHLILLDPSQAVEAALEQARPMIEQAGFTLERSEATQLPQVRADDKALQQSLANLLSNAVKYGKPGRWVRVETAAEDNRGRPEVQIRVRDGGMGIPAVEARKIFDAFYRGSAASEDNIQGSGLGLKLARDLVQGMGGRLSFRSDLNKGSVFTIHLPTHSALGA